MPRERVISPRKQQRKAAQDARAAANAALTLAELLAKVTAEGRVKPSVLRNRKQARDNMKECTRCHRRTIVAGSVCWCRSLGAGA